MTDGKPEWVTYKRTGFRDIYWCHTLGEPMVLEYKYGKMFCPVCQEFDPTYHTFVCHVLRRDGESKK